MMNNLKRIYMFKKNQSYIKIPTEDWEKYQRVYKEYRLNNIKRNMAHKKMKVTFPILKKVSVSLR